MELNPVSPAEVPGTTGTKEGPPQPSVQPPAPSSPPAKKPASILKWVLIVLAVAAVSAATGFLFARNNINLPFQKACTMEAKLCPDGSSVGRTGPDCEFSPCPSPTPDPTADMSRAVPRDWKTFTLGGIVFKYPESWNNPEYIQTPSGQSAEIENNDNTQKIVVLSGINKGKSKENLSEFIDSLVVGGAQKLVLNGSDAAKNSLTYQNSKITTVYVTSQDNTSQYSITFQFPESYSNQEMNILIDQILSTFTFTQ